MADNNEQRLPHLEPMGDATEFASQIHGMIVHSPLFENFTLAEIRQLSHFMQVYRATAGIEVLREGDPGDTLGEMSMIDGEPRFATCVAAEERTTLAVLTRDSLARIILEQPILGSKILMELVQMLSQRLRQTSAKLISYMDRESDGGLR